jgi:hypothetical protein
MGYRDEDMILKYGRRHKQKKTFFAELFSASKSTKSPLSILLKVALLKVIVMLPHCKFSSLLFIRSQPKHLAKKQGKSLLLLQYLFMISSSALGCIPPQ